MSDARDALLAAIVLGLDRPVCAVGLDGRVLAMNDAFARHVQETRGVVPEVGVRTDVIGEAELTRAASGQRWSVLRGPLGEDARYFSKTIAPLELGGEIVGASVVVSDAGDGRSQLRAALSRAIEREGSATFVFEPAVGVVALSDACRSLCTVDERGRVRGVSECCAEACRNGYGCALGGEEAILDKLPEGAKGAWSTVRDAVSSGERVALDLAVGRGAGVRYFDVVASPTEGSRGAFASVAVVRDVTERQRERDERCAADSRARALLEASMDAAFTVDARLSLVAHNAAFADWVLAASGRSPVLGAPLAGQLGDDEGRFLQACLLRCLQGARFRVEHVGPRARRYALSLVPVYSASVVAGAAVVAKDLGPEVACAERTTH